MTPAAQSITEYIVHNNDRLAAKRTYGSSERVSLENAGTAPHTMTTASDTSWWSRIVRSIGSVPTDLVVALGVLAVGDAVVLAGPQAHPVRTIVGLPILFFLPGYVVLAALFPRVDGWRATDPLGGHVGAVGARDGGVDLVERVALSVGTSVAVLPFVGLAMSVAGVRLGTTEIVETLTIGIVLVAIIGWARRLTVPPAQRFRVPFGRWATRARQAVFGAPSMLDATLNVALTLAVLLAFTAVGVGVVTHDAGESYSELSLVTATDDGEYVAADYPRSFEQGESRSLVAGVTNHEGDSAEYTVVVQLHHVRERDGDLTVSQRTQLTTLDVVASPGETVYESHDLRPQTSGENLRLTYLLYKDEPPDSPTIDDAYRHAYLWVNVTD